MVDMSFLFCTKDVLRFPKLCNVITKYLQLGRFVIQNQVSCLNEHLLLNKSVRKFDHSQAVLRLCLGDRTTKTKLRRFYHEMKSFKEENGWTSWTDHFKFWSFDSWESWLFWIILLFFLLTVEVYGSNWFSDYFVGLNNGIPYFCNQCKAFKLKQWIKRKTTLSRIREK